MSKERIIAVFGKLSDTEWIQKRIWWIAEENVLRFLDINIVIVGSESLLRILYVDVLHLLQVTDLTE